MSELKDNETPTNNNNQSVNITNKDESELKPSQSTSTTDVAVTNNNNQSTGASNTTSTANNDSSNNNNNNTTVINKSLKDFKIIKKIGGGNEGAVFLSEVKAESKNKFSLGDEQFVAIKSVSCSDPEEIQNTRNDLNVLLTLKQENIVNHYDIFEEKKKGIMQEQTVFYIVMEYCDGGSLEMEITKRKKEQRPFEVEIVRLWTKQMCQCLNYMHSEKLVHRDLKPDNILLTKNRSLIKVCDFGFTRKDSKLMKNVLGTKQYIAPEMQDGRLYDEAVDIWSLGVLLFQLVNLFAQNEIPDLITEIRQNPNYVREKLQSTTEFKDELFITIIERCLKIDPVDRAEAKDIIQMIEEKRNLEKFDDQQQMNESNSTNESEKKPMDDDVNYLQDILQLLQRRALKQIKDPLLAIKNEKAKQFWKANGWENKKEVTWPDFREAYQEFINWERISKNSERGFKKMVTANLGFDVDLDDDGSGIVTVLSYNELVNKAGFPFDWEILDLIQNCLAIGDFDWNIKPKVLDETKERKAQIEYLQMICQKEKLFADPISQENLYIDKHCEPLKISLQEKDWMDDLLSTPSTNSRFSQFLSSSKHSTPTSTISRLTEFSSDSSPSEFENVYNFQKVHDDAMDKRINEVENNMKEVLNFNDNDDDNQEGTTENKQYIEDGGKFISDLASNTTRLCLLGQASFGKTCMLKYVMLKLAKRALRLMEQSAYNHDKILIPLYIPAGLFGSFPNDADMKIRCIRASAGSNIKNFGKTVKYLDDFEYFLLKAIDDNRVLFIFDGVDEIASPLQKKKLISSLTNLFPTPDDCTDSNGIIICSRLGGIDLDSRSREFFSQFSCALVEPLTFDIQKKIASSRGIADETFLNYLKGKYRELAKTPLILSLIMTEFIQRRSLPEVRCKIYENALDSITKLHYSKTTSDEQKQLKMQKTLKEFLRKVAIFLHKMRKSNFSTDDFTNALNYYRKVQSQQANENKDKGSLFASMGEELVGKGDDWIFEAVSGNDFSQQWNSLKRSIDSGKFPLIVATGEGKYRFSHVSFQNYLVGNTWACGDIETDFRLKENAKFTKSKFIYFKERIKLKIVDPFYKETFLFCGGAMKQQDFIAFIKFLRKKLFKRNITLIDSIVYNMIMERPKEEQSEYSKIVKSLASEERLSILVKGLLHESEDLRKMALERSEMFNQVYNEIGEALLDHLEDNENASQAISSVIPRGEQKYTKILYERLLQSQNNLTLKRRIIFCLGNLADRGDELIINEILKVIENTPKEQHVLIETCIDALSKLCHKGDSKFINSLIGMLSDYNLRVIASTTLGNISNAGDKLVISELSKVASKCQEAALSLGKLADKGDMEIIEVLLECIRENSFDDHIVNESIIGVIIPDILPVIQDKLLEMLLNDRKAIAYRVAIVLGSLSERKNTNLVEILLNLLKTTEKQKDRIIRALAFCSPKEDPLVIKVLLEVLTLPVKQSNYLFREQAALALGQLAKKGDEQVIDVLCKKLSSDQEEVVVACSNSLERLSPMNNEKVLDVFLFLLKHTDIGVVEKAIRFLGRKAERGTRDIIRVLLERLENKEAPEVVRSLCAEALGYLADVNKESIIKSLVMIIKNEGPTYPVLRLFCLKAIGMLKTFRTNDEISSIIFDSVISVSGHQDIDSKKFVKLGISILSLICDISSMIARLKNRVYKGVKPIIFSIVVKAIRSIRQNSQNYKLEDEDVNTLQKLNDLEATFILLENASVDNNIPKK
ncbi:hypothetical protein ABK040_000099 [Willaertia magna]